MSDDEVIKVDLIPRKSGEHLRKPEFSNQEMRREIIKLRQDGTSWQKVSENVQSKFGFSIAPMTARSIHDEEMAKSIIASPKARNSYSKYNALVEKNYAKLQDLTTWWVTTLNKLKDEIVHDEIMVNPAEFMKFIKLTESIEKGNKSILEQLKFISTETDRVKIESKNYIYSPQQINQKIIEFRKVEQESVKVERKQLAKERKEFEEEKEKFYEKNKAMKGGN